MLSEDLRTEKSNKITAKMPINIIQLVLIMEKFSNINVLDTVFKN